MRFNRSEDMPTFSGLATGSSCEVALPAKKTVVKVIAHRARVMRCIVVPPQQIRCYGARNVRSCVTNIQLVIPATAGSKEVRNVSRRVAENAELLVELTRFSGRVVLFVKRLEV